MSSNSSSKQARPFSQDVQILKFHLWPNWPDGKHSNWFQTEGSATTLALCIARRLGPEIIGKTTPVLQKSLMWQDDKLSLSQSWEWCFHGQSAGQPMLLVFSRFWSRTQNWWSKECHDPNLQTAWPFSLSSGQENFFSRATMLYSKPVFAGFWSSLLFPTKLIRRWFTNFR